jgi:hypothetical protein
MEHEFSAQEERLFSLLRQFIALSEGTDFAGRMILLGADGEFIGDAKLSSRGLDAATDALASVNAYKEQMRQDALPEPLLDVDDKDVSDLITEAEQFLANGGIV